MAELLPLWLAPLVLGLAGAFTPCALGINAVFLGRLMGRSQAQRLGDWLVFAVSRALFLTLLGLAFGLVGELAQGLAWGFQVAVNLGLIGLGLLLILHGRRPLPLPGLHLSRVRWLQGRGGAAGLGILFGLDISACIGPLVLGLLAQTVALGNWLAGGAVLFLFGVSLSLPLLVGVVSEGAAQALTAFARRHRSRFYVVAGGVFVLLGAAELWLSGAGRYIGP